MNSRILCLAVLAAGLLAAPLSSQVYVDLPLGSWANDVTPDGKTVLGTWPGGRGFIWNWQDDPAPTIVDNGDIVAVSDDGTVVAGNAFDASVGTTVASIWTAATGWQSLDWLPGAPCGTSYSTAYDISGDGTTVVGLGWAGCGARGFRWTQATGMQELQNLGNGTNRCSAISGDGSTMGGFAQGSFSRTPAYWDATTAGFMIDFNGLGEVYGFNEDGSVSVGTYDFGGNHYGAYVRDEASGAMTNLGSLNNNWGGNATDISEDGSVVVGYDVNGLSRQAWIWTSSDGIRSVNQRVLDAGLGDIDSAFVCRAVSDDGNVVVGGGLDGGGGPFGFGGFIFAMSDPTLYSVGGGTSGAAGAPWLVADGDLTAGSTLTLDLTDAPASTPMLLWLSLSSTPLNKFGGTIHALPVALELLLSSDPGGANSLSATWPAGVPSGAEMWFQYLTKDVSSSFDITLSNAVKATAP